MLHERIHDHKYLLSQQSGYRIVQKVVNFDGFDEWLAIRQRFLLLTFPLNVSPMKRTISSRQSFVHVFPCQTFALYGMCCYAIAMKNCDFAKLPNLTPPITHICT